MVSTRIERKTVQPRCQSPQGISGDASFLPYVSMPSMRAYRTVWVAIPHRSRCAKIRRVMRMREGSVMLERLTARSIEAALEKRHHRSRQSVATQRRLWHWTEACSH